MQPDAHSLAPIELEYAPRPDHELSAMRHAAARMQIVLVPLSLIGIMAPATVVLHQYWSQLAQHMPISIMSAWKAVWIGTSIAQVAAAVCFCAVMVSMMSAQRFRRPAKAAIALLLLEAVARSLNTAVSVLPLGSTGVRATICATVLALGISSTCTPIAVWMMVIRPIFQQRTWARRVAASTGALLVLINGLPNLIRLPLNLTLWWGGRLSHADGEITWHSIGAIVGRLHHEWRLDRFMMLLLLSATWFVARSLRGIFADRMSHQ